MRRSKEKLRLAELRATARLNEAVALCGKLDEARAERDRYAAALNRIAGLDYVSAEPQQIAADALFPERVTARG